MAGSTEAMQDGDNVITAYRDHVHPIAMGVPAGEVLAELYGKSNGCVGGVGGSMHMFSKEKKFWGSHGIVGGQVPLGAGIAFAEKYRGTKNVTLTYMGDGAVRQGAFPRGVEHGDDLELRSFSSLRTTTTRWEHPWKEPITLPTCTSLGMLTKCQASRLTEWDPVAVYEAVNKAAERARKERPNAVGG